MAARNRGKEHEQSNCPPADDLRDNRVRPIHLQPADAAQRRQMPAYNTEYVVRFKRAFDEIADEIVAGGSFRP